MSSKAAALRSVTELSSLAVIGNEILSQKYNLEIIASNIQDYDNNLTTFCCYIKIISGRNYLEMTKLLMIALAKGISNLVDY